MEIDRKERHVEQFMVANFTDRGQPLRENHVVLIHIKNCSYLEVLGGDLFQ